MAVMLPNMIPFVFTTSIVDTATNTTLGTATRLNFSSPVPITIAETGSRTFLSVILHVGFRDRNTTGAATDLNGTRLGIQLGAVAFDDLDRTITQTGSTTNHWWTEWTRDCTAYFNTNFGAGTTQTCQAALAVSQAVASAIGGNITAWLEITYAFDDTVGSTRTKFIPIGVGSQAGNTFTLVAQEVGTDGTNGPGANQIPILTGGSGLIKEASPSIVQSWIFAEASDNNNVAGTDEQPEWTIDSTIFARNVLGENTTGNTCWYRDIVPYDTGTFSTTTVHALKFRDIAVTGRYACMGATLFVVYTYDKSSTTRMLNAARVAIQQSGDSHQVPWIGGINNGVAADAIGYYFDLNVQEPGTITLERAHVVIDLINIAAGSVTSFSAGAQAFRAYTSSASGGTTNNIPIIHRCDYGSGWSLARGDNHLLLRQINAAGGNRGTLGYAYAWILYSSDVPAGGPCVGTRSLAFHGFSYANATTVSLAVDMLAAGQTAPSFQNTIWTLQSMFLEGMAQSTGAIIAQAMLQLAAGEFDGAGWQTSTLTRTLIGVLQARYWRATVTHLMNRHWLAIGKMAPQVAHRCVVTMTTSGIASMISRPTIHNISFPVAGVVTVDGAPAANGGFVDIFAYDGAVNTEHITEVLIAGGAGAFTAQVPDNTRLYFAVYTNAAGTRSGSTSVLGLTPGASFNIAVGASAIELTGQPTVSSPLTTATFTFTATGPVEYSLDGAGYVTTTSPLNLASLGTSTAHTITFRLVSDPTDKQTFAWTSGVAGGGGGDVTPPTQTVVSPPASTSFGTDYPHAANVPAVVTVVDAASAVAFLMVFVQFSDRNTAELVYAGTGSQLGFLTPYKSYSSISGSGAAGVGYTLSVRRDDAWPQSTNGLPITAAFTYKAVDAAGNVLS